MVDFREAFPGANFFVFDCQALHASLSREACADNWRNTRCLACNGCPIGAEHAGEKPTLPRPSRAPCIRCGRTDQRLLHKSLCISCWNRSREVLIGQNAKGERPAKWGSLLRHVYAIVRAPVEGIRAAYRSPPRARHRPCLPVLAPLQPGVYWLEVIAQSADEATAMLHRMFPEAEVIDIEAGPTFTAMHCANSPANLS